MGLLARLLTYTCVFAVSFAQLNPLSDEFIDLINSKQTTWRAGRNFPVDIHIEHIAKLTGVIRNDNANELPTVEAEFFGSLPENFDPRDKWPNCPSLNEIRDQGCCNSCWALGAVAAMTDRVCTYSNGTKQFHFSADDLIGCCEDCGYRCQGGDPVAAWNFWVKNGLVSGGNYNNSQGCIPYTHYTIPDKPCNLDETKTPECQRTCQVEYNVTYENDKHYGKRVYSVKGEDNIKAELYHNGPIEASFAVYEDFLQYKSGVYHHTEGSHLVDHAVKMIGWGVEDGTKYWLIANSWNVNWGDKGFFKILRGVNHCGIEDGIIAGEPR